MDEVTLKGLHRIKVKDDKGDPDEALLEIRFRKRRVLPPIGKQKKYPALTLTVIHAQEREGRSGERRSSGSFSPISRSNRVRMPSRRSNGTR
ncbi:hypothetical protein J4G48_0049680 (plasmid) [Bradyrhizobium barranii subsp. apii]|uniref:hypothetical protein n=1 Tax=Bradyrhizobium TaxID=374 RepID=UPI001CD49D08|nr:hypothetical protein [Bradyrhizobium barranii]UPU01684.1 hypothetical protein J4G48_0049680 [Bradyrhizobium barranii subsp. apii]